MKPRLQLRVFVFAMFQFLYRTISVNRSRFSAPQNAKRCLKMFASESGPTVSAATLKMPNAPKVYAYAQSVQLFHWSMGAGILFLIASAKLNQWTPKDEKERKKTIMWYHKSVGLLMGLLIAPRLLARFSSKIPDAIPGPYWEHFASKLSHGLLYSLMVVMPVTGITMGYLGGGGLPFFFMKVPASTNKNKKLAGLAFKLHKKAGLALEYLVPIHVGAVAYHAAKRFPILSRMWNSNPSKQYFNMASKKA